MSVSVKPQIEQARSYFTDEKSIAIFDAYVKRGANNQDLWTMDYNPDWAQISDNLKEDFSKAKTLPKPRKFFIFGGGEMRRDSGASQRYVCSALSL
jgi:hypothetical protein